MNAPSTPKLLVIASTYPRWHGDHEPGFVHELSKRMTKDFQVTVLCPHSNGAKTREQLDGVNVIRYRYAPQKLERLVNDGGIVTNLKRHRWMALLLPTFALSQLLHLCWLLWRKPPQAIHAHWIIPQAFIAALAKSITGRHMPIMVTSHGADLYALNGSLMRRIKQWAISRCQQATVVSHAMLPELRALGMPAECTTVAPMGVDMTRFCPDAQTTRNPHELLFVGRLVEKKGLRHLIDALPLVMERHPLTRLTIAGFGPELEEREHQVRQLGLQDSVDFLGAVTQTQLPMLYRRAAMLVAPFIQAESGDREGLGLVSVEALACGCPVVTTRIDAVKEVFGGHWPDYLAEPADPASLARQIIRALDEPASLVATCQSIRENVVVRFGWDHVAAGYKKYLCALGNQTGRTG